MTIEEQGNKIKTSISISKYLFDRMGELIQREMFTSKSDIITTALSEFFGRLDEKEEMKNKIIAKDTGLKIKKDDLLTAFEKFLQSEQGKSALYELLSYKEKSNDNNSTSGDLKKQGRYIIIE